MSEHVHSPEEHKFTPEPETRHHERHAKTAENGPEQEIKPEAVHKLEKQVKEEAVSGKEVTPGEQAAQPDSPMYVNRELKRESWQRSMNSVRKQLSAPSRALSKIIHQPVVDSVSRASAQTVARPSGLLGGSICAFLGSSFFLWMSRHYGFAYNYLLFLLFFVGGFAVGLVLEMLFFLVRRRRA